MLVGGWVALRQHPGVLGYVTHVRGMRLTARGRARAPGAGAPATGAVAAPRTCGVAG